MRSSTENHEYFSESASVQMHLQCICGPNVAQSPERLDLARRSVDIRLQTSSYVEFPFGLPFTTHNRAALLWHALITTDAVQRLTYIHIHVVLLRRNLSLIGPTLNAIRDPLRLLSDSALHRVAGRLTFDVSDVCGSREQMSDGRIIYIETVSEGGSNVRKFRWPAKFRYHLEGNIIRLRHITCQN